MESVINNIQAFPLRRDTYQGTPTAKSLLRGDGNLEWNLVHLQADATVTITWDDSTTTVIAGLAGEDFAIADGATAITSTSQVILS